MRAVTSALCDAELLPRIWVRGQALFQAGEEPEAVQLVPQAFMNDLVIFLEGDPLEVLRKLSRATAVFTSSLLFFMVVHLLSLVCLCLFSSVFFSCVFFMCVFPVVFSLSLFLHVSSFSSPMNLFDSYVFFLSPLFFSFLFLYSQASNFVFFKMLLNCVFYF